MDLILVTVILLIGTAVWLWYITWDQMLKLSLRSLAREYVGSHYTYRSRQHKYNKNGSILKILLGRLNLPVNINSKSIQLIFLLLFVVAVFYLLNNSDYTFSKKIYNFIFLIGIWVFVVAIKEIILFEYRNLYSKLASPIRLILLLFIIIILCIISFSANILDGRYLILLSLILTLLICVVVGCKKIFAFIIIFLKEMIARLKLISLFKKQILLSDEMFNDANISFNATLNVPQKLYKDDSKNITLRIDGVKTGFDTKDVHLEVELQAAGLKSEGDKKKILPLNEHNLSYCWNCHFATSGVHEISLILRLISKDSIEQLNVIEHTIRVNSVDHLTQRQIYLLSGIFFVIATIISILYQLGIV